MPDQKVDTEELKFEVASYVQARWGAEAVCVLIVSPRDNPSGVTYATQGDPMRLAGEMRKAADQIEAQAAKGGGP